MDGAKIKRWAKRAGIAAGLSALALFALLGALFVWLGTESARRSVLRLAEDALAAQGLYLQVEKSSGRLPFSLQLEGVSLSDASGQWLGLAALDLEFNPWWLFGLVAQVDKLRLEGAVLSRLPTLPPGEPAAPTGQKSSGPPSLPLDIRLNNASLDSLVVQPGLFALLLPEQAADFARLEPLRLELESSAAVQRGLIMEPGHIQAELKAALRSAGGALELYLRTGPKDGLLDSLFLNLSLREASGGLAALFSGLKDLPPYEISLASRSSLGDIRLELGLEAEGLLSLTGSLGLRPLGSGSPRQSAIERLACPNWELEAALKAAPGPLLSQPGGSFAALPELLLDLLGPELELALKAHSAAKGAGALLSVESLVLDNHLARAGLEEGNLHIMPDGLEFSGNILAEVKGERFFELVGASSEGIPMFGQSSLRLGGRAALNTQGDKATLDFSLKGPLAAQSRHPLFSGPDIGALQAELEAKGRFDGQLRLEALRFDGVGLSIDGQAELDFAPLVIALDAELSAAPGGAWNNILRHLSSGVPELGFKAAVQAGLDLRPESAARELTAKVRLEASDYVWPAGILADVFGSYAAVQADFSGPLLSPYNMTLYGLSTGFKPLESRSYQPEELLPDGESSRALGWFELSLAGEEPLRLMPRWSRRQQIDMLTLNGRVEACLDNAWLFLPEDNGFSGPLRASASIEGLVGGDDTILDLQGALSNWAGQVLQSGLGEMSLSSKVNVDLRLRGGLSMLGQATLQASSSKAGPLALSTGWEVAQPEGADLKLGLSKLQAAFAEVSLRGDAAAFLPDEAGRPPRLEGSLQATFDNWKALNAIFERLELDIPPLSGSGTRLDIKMSASGGTQTAELGFNLERLHMLLDPDGDIAALPSAKEPQPPLGSPGLALFNGIQGRVDVKDLWGKRLITGHLKTDTGSIDLESWQSAALYLDLAGNVGRVNAAVRGDAHALARAQAVHEDAPAFTPQLVERYLSGLDAAPTAAAPPLPGANGPDKFEMAAAEAVFRVSPPAFSLRRAAMFAPELQSGLRLQSPVIVNLENGLQMDKLDLAVLPEGHIRAQAHISAEHSQAEADVKDLPLALLRKLTGLPLPDGELSLQGSVLAQEGRITGQSDVLAVLRQAGGSAGATPFTLRLKSAYGPGSGRYRASAPGHARFSGAGSLTAGDSAGGQGLQLSFDLPVRSAEQGFLRFDLESPLEARASWSGDITQAWRLLPLADRRLGGLARLEARLGGTFARLEYQGEAYLAGAHYEDSVLGFSLSDINMEAKAGKDGARISLAGGDGREGSLALDARLSGNGAFATGLDGGPRSSQPELTARGQINHLAPLHRDDLALMLSGILDASGPVLSPLLSGKFVVEQGNFNLMSSLGGGVTTLPVEERSEFAGPVLKDKGPHLDLKVEAPGRFYVRGAGLDSEWRASATLNGPLSNPNFSAVITPVRGYFELLSRPFAISKGQIGIWGGRDYLDSDLDLLLAYTSSSISAEIAVGGSLKRPSLTLGSRPALPQDQILSQVIFGKDITQLTALEALQVANGVRQIVSFGQGGLDVMGEVRELLGVDTLRIGSTATGTHTGSISGSPDASAFGVNNGRTDAAAASPTLEAGKYINDSIYVGVEQGAVEDSTRVRVEIELRPNLTLQGSSGAQSSQIGLGWKRDY